MFKLPSRTTDVQAICVSNLYVNTPLYKAFTKNLQYATRCV